MKKQRRPLAKIVAGIFGLLLLSELASVAHDIDKHLFVLSGQSNLARLDPNETFTPAVIREFGKDNVIVVHDAKGGEPIRRWYKKWKPANGARIKTVTFVWMQGESDSKENGRVYAASLRGLIDQLANDLGRQDINFVIGRLSDHSMDKRRFPHWTMVRQAQVAVAEADPRGAWVDIDDLNSGMGIKGKKVVDDLHYSVEGYQTLGRRFAEAAISLIKKVGR